MIFAPESRWARSWLRFFRLPLDELERFLLNLRVAALFHDIGKANADFQRAVTRPGPLQQSVRHEHISGLVLCHRPVRDWLSYCGDLDLEAITAAVLGHHLKVAEEGTFGWCQFRAADRVELHLLHDETVAILERVSSTCGLPAPPCLPGEPLTATGAWGAAYQSGLSASRRYARRGRRDLRLRGFFAAVKAGVIVADSLASAMAREGLSTFDWLDRVAHTERITHDEIQAKIIEPRLRQMGERRGTSAELHSFQRRAAELGDRVLLLAACGSGKTLAAWNWAAAQAAAAPVGRVVFLYPTRGTATEGFRDYVGWAPETESLLLHGTSAYELTEMRSNPPDSLRGKSLDDESADRLFALGHWSRRFFSATVDQFLSFLENRYPSLVLLPVLADSVVIIDEVHSFDRTMFDRLIAFLEACDVPVLCMTATLPAGRKQQLAAQGLRMYPEEAERSELAELDQAERHPRYRLRIIDGATDAFDLVEAAFGAGKRVLWVVNTVARCQALVSDLTTRLGTPVLAYHSRFRLRDRTRQHAQTVAAFQQRERPALAVTTQVCEMSLDLDADVLVSEFAPVTSLVQRFGRANRHLARGPEFRAELLAYRPERAVPYSAQALVAAENFLGALAGRDLSQRDLADALETHAPGEPLAEGAARFLDVGYWATRGSFRDEDDFTAQCVLDSDLEDVARTFAAKEPIDGYVLSVPKRFVSVDDDRPSWLAPYIHMAPGELYSEALGFVNPEGK